ncbi:hypothetical protein ACFQPA_11305 [Halomarina halobia]|uniref:Uncharacterized protein n=1 Tax=Halomarina halobia TaxID=3033386 RepID=A0ABD6ABE0_9EURY|nr:hypothetical protein [Halomarina sp. PSR21]
MDEHGTRVGDGWEQVIDDMEATADAYREEGYDVVALHPGDVTTADDGSGFDVVVPGEEFERVQAQVGAAALDQTEVFRAANDGVVYVLVVVRDDDVGVAVCCPLYYAPERIGEVREYAAETGQVLTYLRSLSSEEAVAVAFDSPELFFPE